MEELFKIKQYYEKKLGNKFNSFTIEIDKENNIIIKILVNIEVLCSSREIPLYKAYKMKLYREVFLHYQKNNLLETKVLEYFNKNIK